MSDSSEPVYLWRVRARLPERYGTLCQILARSRRMNSCLVRFLADGHLVITSRNYVRKADPSVQGLHGGTERAATR